MAPGQLTYRSYGKRVGIKTLTPRFLKGTLLQNTNMIEGYDTQRILIPMIEHKRLAKINVSGMVSVSSPKGSRNSWR